MTEITRAVLERALEAEMSDHLGYEEHDPATAQTCVIHLIRASLRLSSGKDHP